MWSGRPGDAGSGSMLQHPALVVLSAKNSERLREQVRQLLKHLEAAAYAPEVLRDLAYTLQVGREAMSIVWPLTARTLEELKEKLRRLPAGQGREWRDRGVLPRGAQAAPRGALGIERG